MKQTIIPAACVLPFSRLKTRPVKILSSSASVYFEHARQPTCHQPAQFTGKPKKTRAEINLSQTSQLYPLSHPTQVSLDIGRFNAKFACLGAPGSPRPLGALSTAIPRRAPPAKATPATRRGLSKWSVRRVLSRPMRVPPQRHRLTEWVAASAGEMPRKVSQMKERSYSRRFAFSHSLGTGGVGAIRVEC
jgi:hypothetical protein